MTRVYFGLGANIDPANALRAGMAALTSTFTNVKYSSVYQTQAVNLDGPDFLNMVASVDCHLTFTALRDWIAITETRHGRTRPSATTSPKTPTTQPPTSHGLDIDILLFGERMDEQQNIPRSDIWHCAYVLKPLSQLAPQLTFPNDTRTALALWQNFNKAAPIKKVVIENLLPTTHDDLFPSSLLR